jgi:hypothetical protein
MAVEKKKCVRWRWTGGKDAADNDEVSFARSQFFARGHVLSSLSMDDEAERSGEWSGKSLCVIAGGRRRWARLS